jgi:hypothetical protein
MWKHAALLAIAVAVPLWAQQTDTPVTAADTVDRVNAAEKERRDKIRIDNGARVILLKRLGSDPGSDPAAQAPFIELDLRTCLANGDYKRTMKQIYTDAAGATGRLAKELLAKASAPVTVVAGPAVAAIDAQIADAQHRNAELEAKGTLNNSEKQELVDLGSLERQLQEARTVYLRMMSGAGDAAKSTAAAEEMAEKEVQFRSEARKADAHAAIFNLQCDNDRKLLVGIDQHANEHQMLDVWGKVPGGETVPKVNVTPQNIAAPTGVSNSEMDKFKEDELILRDPEELQKRLDYLRAEISGQKGATAN